MKQGISPIKLTKILSLLLYSICQPSLDLINMLNQLVPLNIQDILKAIPPTSINTLLFNQVN